MSAERKIQRAQSGVKPRRKSTSHLMEESHSPSAGSLISLTSTTSSNDINNIRHLSESSIRKDTKPSLSRNSSTSSNLRQRKYSEVIPRKQELHSSPGYAPSKSMDTSGLTLTPQISVQGVYQPNNKDAMDYYFSTEREVTIEEEQYARIMHLYQMIMLWKKRWKQMRDQNILLSDKLETMEEEYRGVCASMKEIYERKLQKMKEDMRKVSKSRDEMHKEKRSLESSFKHMLDHNKMEKGEFEAKLMEQTDEIKMLKDNLSDQTSKLECLKREIAAYAKKDANNNEISLHNKTLLDENYNLANKLKSIEIQLNEANLRDENYKLLLDTSLDKLRLLEQCVPKRDRTRKWKCHAGRYVLRVDHSQPLHMYLEDLDYTNQQKIETQSLGSLDSLESIAEHLDDDLDSILNDGILATPGDKLQGYHNCVPPPNYREALKLTDSTTSGISGVSSGGRSSYLSNIGSTSSTPSVFSDCQSPILNPASPEHLIGKSQNSRIKHIPLQKSHTIDGELTPTNSPGSVRSSNGISPDTIHISDVIHSVPDLRHFNHSVSPPDTHVTHITQSASQLPIMPYTADYDPDTYTNHVRKGSMDADILLSDTLKRKKKKVKSSHQRRGSLDFDLLVSQSQKPSKPSRFDFLHRHKNGMVDEDAKGKVRRSKASEFADIFRKLTSSSSNLHDTEKKQNGLQKKRKSRSLKERR